MKRILTCLILAGLAQSAQAQAVVSFGPRLGGNLATATLSSLDNASGTAIALNYETSAIVAPQLGLVMNMQWNNWAFQPALLFSQKGLKQKYSSDFANSGYRYHESLEVTSRINYLELPLNVVYTTGGDTASRYLAGLTSPWVSAAKLRTLHR